MEEVEMMKEVGDAVEVEVVEEKDDTGRVVDCVAR